MKTNITGCIYVHINKINGKSYVGQTTKHPPTQRWNNGLGYSTQRKFYSAILKYGWDNFDHIILEDNIPQQLLNEREKYWIKEYNSVEAGYNVTEGGDSGPMTDEAKQHISDGWSKEQRAKQSERVKERWKTDKDFRDKALNALRTAPHADMRGEKNPMYGMHRTGKDAARKQRVQCIETGQCFDTIKEAAEWLGSVGQKSHISEVCKGKRKTCGRHPITKEPLHWRYILDD